MRNLSHINELNTIVSQLKFIDINFDNEIHSLILLVSLPNTWKLMLVAINNSIGKGNLQFNSVRNRILVEEVRKIDLDERL